MEIYNTGLETSRSRKMKLEIQSDLNFQVLFNCTWKKTFLMKASKTNKTTATVKWKWNMLYISNILEVNWSYIQLLLNLTQIKHHSD